VTRGTSIRRTLLRALSLVPLFVLLTTATAVADVQVTPLAPPDSSKCSLLSPSAQCGQWTYWASLGALVIGVLIVVAFVVKYLKDAPRFQTETDGRGRAGRPGAGARPRAPPPAGAAPAPAAAPAPVGAVAAPAASGGGAAAAAAVAQPVGGQAEAGPSGGPAAPAAAPAERHAPSPRHEPVEPDQATYDRVLAEQLAKGTDRRVAEGRAKAAALKAAREQAGG
jgi:hypothetical protein